MHHAAFLRVLLLLISLGSTLVALGCDQTDAGTSRDRVDDLQNREASSQYCEPRIPGNGFLQRIARPVSPSSCLAIVILCHVWEYDATGIFVGEVATPCGACLGWDL